MTKAEVKLFKRSQKDNIKGLIAKAVIEILKLKCDHKEDWRDLTLYRGLDDWECEACGAKLKG